MKSRIESRVDGNDVTGEWSQRKTEPAKGKRYSPAQRKEILEYAQKHSVKEAAKEFGATETSIYDWRRAIEFGYMFYQNLGGTLGQPIPPNGDPDVLALFPSLQSDAYWSGTEFNSSDAWAFWFSGGFQDGGVDKTSGPASWAVHAGNVVPVPAAVWLFGSGLMGLLGLSRRKR